MGEGESGEGEGGGGGGVCGQRNSLSHNLGT